MTEPEPKRVGRCDPLSSQPGEQIQEGTKRRLVFVESGQAALGHVGHDLDLAPQVQVGMPSRRQLAEVRFGETILHRDLGRCFFGSLDGNLHEVLVERFTTSAPSKGQNVWCHSHHSCVSGWSHARPQCITSASFQPLIPCFVSSGVTAA
jgi:hypothetical protein